jgi:dTDP-4-amino-4,6-dideoxygalactose transaminase
MDPLLIEALITENTIAIVPVHLYGRVCNVSAIEQIASDHKLTVFYDAAHAFGCKYQDTAVGSFGSAEVLSFHATKFFHSIEVCSKHPSRRSRGIFP